VHAKILSGSWNATLAIFTVTCLLTGTGLAGEKVLHNFKDDGKDGHKPLAALIFDASGNLYGTTSEGGTGTEYCPGGCGTVFELMPKGDGTWTEKVLHSFNEDGTDGAGPAGSLVFDASGNLYGTTSGGGAYAVYGTVFELTPTAGGQWKENILHSFNYGKNEGSMPFGGLIFGAAGNLYGTTYAGGAYGGGTVFELVPQAGGSWTQKILHSFKGDKNGSVLEGTLILDAAGNLYGTTIFGGDLSCGGGTGCGTVFELTPEKDGSWTEKVLWTFSGKDGDRPLGVVFNAAGNLYGATALGGDLSCDNGYGCGTVFELTPKKNGSWTERVLWILNAETPRGYYPWAGPILDARSNLYGTTNEGGDFSCYYGYGCGTVFELTQKADGYSTGAVLYTFSKDGVDGSNPGAGLVRDHSGNLYGSTIRGGNQSCGSESDGCGTVFEITP